MFKVVKERIAEKLYKKHGMTKEQVMEVLEGEEFKHELKNKLIVSAGKAIGELNTILLTIFIVLKLLNLITWNWLWVLSPLWIPVSLIIIYLFWLRTFKYKVWTSIFGKKER